MQLTVCQLKKYSILLENVSTLCSEYKEKKKFECARETEGQSQLV